MAANILDLIMPYLTGQGAPTLPLVTPEMVGGSSSVSPLGDVVKALHDAEIANRLDSMRALAAQGAKAARAAPQAASGVAPEGITFVSPANYAAATTKQGLASAARLIPNLAPRTPNILERLAALLGRAGSSTLGAVAAPIGLGMAASKYAVNPLIEKLVAGRSEGQSAQALQEQQAGISPEIMQAIMAAKQRRADIPAAESVPWWAEGIQPIPESQRAPAAYWPQPLPNQGVQSVQPDAGQKATADKWTRMARLDSQLMQRAKDPKHLPIMRSRFYEKLAGLGFTNDQLGAFVKDGIAGVKEDDKMSDADKVQMRAAFTAWQTAQGQRRVEVSGATKKRDAMLKDPKKAAQDMGLGIGGSTWFAGKATPEQIAAHVPMPPPVNQEQVMSILSELLPILNQQGGVDISKLPSGAPTQGSGREMVFPDGTKRFVPAGDIPRAAAMGGK